MVTFIISSAALFLGQLFHGKLGEKVFVIDNPDSTTATAMAVGVMSGFHADRLPLKVRCMTQEKYGRHIFYFLISKI